ncbi:zeta toxin family protein [Frankia sp. Cr1]|uniref:zeta toxin family protein n=1 Tax=Frankia sp. Cr1 TaxID=3073931 RepID=UPI002AD3AB10|nr:zeta toxin family protein [Frankia sp. Cr1]
MPAETGNARAAPHPLVVFLVAQPGSGKTRVARQLAVAFDDRGGFIDVDSDRYKPFHPDYDQLMTENDRAMALHTGFDGRRWVQAMHEHVRSHRLNALVQATAIDPASVGENMARYRTAGYQVAAAFLGVPEAMSQQGVVHRYHEQVRDRGSGRLTVAENARRSYAGIPLLADLIDAERLADLVVVVRRGEVEPRYANQLGPDGNWTAPPHLRAAVETERNRPWTPGETADFQAVQRTLVAGMGAEWSGRLAEAEPDARLRRAGLSVRELSPAANGADL